MAALGLGAGDEPWEHRDVLVLELGSWWGMLHPGLTLGGMGLGAYGNWAGITPHSSSLEGKEDAHSSSPLYFVLVLDPALYLQPGLSNPHSWGQAAAFSARTGEIQINRAKPAVRRGPGEILFAPWLGRRDLLQAAVLPCPKNTLLQNFPAAGKPAPRPAGAARLSAGFQLSGSLISLLF